MLLLYIYPTFSNNNYLEVLPLQMSKVYLFWDALSLWAFFFFVSFEICLYAMLRIYFPNSFRWLTRQVFRYILHYSRVCRTLDSMSELLFCCFELLYEIQCQ